MDQPAGAHAAVGRDAVPRISVIVPTWNEAKYLPALFESLRRQTVPPDEVIVADSGAAAPDRPAGRGDRRGFGKL